MEARVTIREYPAIADYAIIGDCRTAALISRDGSIDWLCLPRFDSPSLFGALLDPGGGGRFRIRPVGRFRSERRYIEDTPVLETTFVTDEGVARLVDLMPVIQEEHKLHELWPDHEVLRMVECTEGELELELQWEPRPDYGRAGARITDRGQLGFCQEYRATLAALRSELDLRLAADRRSVEGRVRLGAGDRRFVSFSFAHTGPAIVPKLGEHARVRVERSISWWQEWSRQCTYEGEYRDSVVRSAITLKLMAYAPSGAVVAAPTTSLPERVGGIRNWDYRYCWLRDASLTLQALYDLGYDSEAEAFLSWLLYTTRITWPELQVVYDVFGETNLRERELSHLRGYRDSQPVRVGNAAEGQFQLDTYGELIDAIYEFVARGGRLDRATSRLLVGLGRTVCDRWRDPDEGIWEIRGRRRHHTLSKAMCWVALDRLLRLDQEGHIKVPVRRFTTERDSIREEIERHGYSERLKSYITAFDLEDVDASLLLLARYGYVGPEDSRMLGTYERIMERLGKNGLLYRYLSDHDGLPSGEGVFGICSFWAVEYLARKGSRAEARSSFEHLLSFCNDVGLLAEEIDADTGEAVGNFPQAFTHVGLIDAALTLGGFVEGRRGVGRTRSDGGRE
jgi:GH15 family glucan-1,4-alpha-glucosidase